MLTILTVTITAESRLTRAQIPEKPENLQHFPKDITRAALVQRMREFSFALNVRCQYCHAGGDGVSFDGVVFKSDDKAAKRKARAMLKMVDEINGKLLATIPERQSPPVRIDCVTCHRGSPVPMTLATLLTETIAADGIDAAVAKYKQLRANTLESGRFDFGEWSMNELGRTLAESGRRDAAIAMLRLNGEHYPKSAAIDMLLADLYVATGDTEHAIIYLKQALTKQPDNPAAKRKLDELMKK
jgi:tetratricopeptide (TPR) repeat protein